MYIDRIKSKKHYYLYLRKYDADFTYAVDKRVIVYGLGREENALADMEVWSNDISLLPVVLKKMGITKKDIDRWIINVEKRRKKALSV